MDQIRFAEDYNAMSEADKSVWLARQYRNTLPPASQNHVIDECISRCETLGYERWERAFEHVVLARKRLTELFRLVCTALRLLDKS